ncbi:MAG: hypothetical protein WBG81_04610 [Rhodanobacter sp.]|uniref:hypothetical protein n=1 Tax=Rhodanobacter sp. KK11 TaxID=3083255 RepID=UPI002965E496|nr:hypothetical protein [Rhodanobacter sp. KK11]MDW2982361.1 hypothetical protein [Rhodanobacter sp. KK11]
MKTRCVFSTPDLTAARAAMAAAQAAGIDDRDISLLAREDIELERIPDHLLQGRNDFYPAALRGGACGGGTGLLLGLIAVAVPPLGVTLAGAAAMAVAGAAFGSCIGEIVGFEVPDTVSRKFKAEIAAGRILVVIDARRDQLGVAESAVARTGATPLPFHAHTVLT